MKKKCIFHIVVFVTLFILVSCATTLTREGALIRPVTERQKECCCEYISLITASEEWGINQAADAESAINQSLNKAAALGGNAIYIITVSQSIWGTTVTAEALKCNFEKMRNIE